MRKTPFTTNRIHFAAALAAAMAAPFAGAELIPLSPAGGEVVALVPDAQKTVMAPQTLEERIALFREDREHGGKVIRHDQFWRKAKPLVLTWQATEGEIGPWKVEIATNPMFEGAEAYYIGTNSLDLAFVRETAGDAVGNRGETVAFTVPRANLEIGRPYSWRVTGSGQLAEGQKKRPLVLSDAAWFVTEDCPPRWIALEGVAKRKKDGKEVKWEVEKVHNIRDFGGWRTEDGRRVRQGMAFRGQGLNLNSLTGEHRGRIRLSGEDILYFTRTLGIRTDLDLRSKGETADLDESPLGPGVRLILRSSECYRGIFRESGKKIMAENVRVFCDPANYPIYFHCIGGADRTGSLAYMLLGFLGVPRHDIETDWESTFYPNIPDDVHEKEPDFWCRESHFTDGLMKYGGPDDTWQRRIELYFLDCGLTPDELARLKDLLLE